MRPPRLTGNPGYQYGYESNGIPEHEKNRLLNEVDREIDASEARTKDALGAMLRASNKGAPRYALAVYACDFAASSGKKKPAHRWLLDEVQFGTMLYCYLRGSKDGKGLKMNLVCEDWEQSDGTPMNYGAIKTKKAQAISGRLPATLDKALADTGFPYVQPRARIERPNRGKMGTARPTARTGPYLDKRRSEEK
jgi:hypothetical protein